MINVDLFRTPRKANTDGYQAVGIIHFDADEFGGSMNCPILRKDGELFADMHTLMVHVPQMLQVTKFGGLARVIERVWRCVAAIHATEDAKNNKHYLEAANSSYLTEVVIVD